MTPRKIAVIYNGFDGATKIKKAIQALFEDPDGSRINIPTINPEYASVQFESENRVQLVIFDYDVRPISILRIAAMWPYPVYKIRLVDKQPFRRWKGKSLINEQVRDLEHWDPKKFQQWLTKVAKRVG